MKEDLRTIKASAQDAEALDFTRPRLSRFGGRVTLVKDNFSNLTMALDDLGIDRIELRRRNLVPKDEMPYRLATITPCDADDELDSGDHSETLDRCLAEFDWDEKSDLQGRLIDGRRHLRRPARRCRRGLPDGGLHAA